MQINISKIHRQIVVLQILMNIPIMVMSYPFLVVDHLLDHNVSLRKRLWWEMMMRPLFINVRMKKSKNNKIKLT